MSMSAWNPSWKFWRKMEGRLKKSGTKKFPTSLMDDPMPIEQSQHRCWEKVNKYSTFHSGRIIPTFLIMPLPDTLLCRWSLVISNNTHSWRYPKYPKGDQKGNYTVQKKLYLLKWHFRVLGSAKKITEKNSGNIKSENLKPAPPFACFHVFFLGFSLTMLYTLV